ncbi:MAG: hypothetical protein V4679_08710 [Pseudomonadota bacterium]
MYWTQRIPPFKTLMASAVFMGLAACGGGGGDDPIPTPYALGGTVSGLPSGQAVVLSSGGGEDLAVAADGSFTFTNRLADGARYSVTLKTAPQGLGCVVRNGSGTVAASAVTTVAVRCVPLATLSDGAWEQDRCQPAANSGVRDLWNLTTNASSGQLTVGVGTVSYANAQCDGVGVAASGALSRTFWFQQERTEAGAGLVANWGKRQTFPGGLLNPAVFTPVVLVRKANQLCLLEDTAVPSAFPNAASLEPAVSTAIAAGQCYAPR